MKFRPEDILPVKTFPELMDDSLTRLREAGFRITNLRPGGVFRTLLEISNQGLADLYALVAEVLQQMYVDTAEGIWLDLRVGERGVFRQEATAARRNVMFIRGSNLQENLIVPAGVEVATELDNAGNRLKFSTPEQTVIPAGEPEWPVLVEAESPGARYNGGKITDILTSVDGIIAIRDEGWIIREGADEEDCESLRARAKDAPKRQAEGGPRVMYEVTARNVPGVVVVWVDDEHPRGQGSVDVYITGVMGPPSEQLIEEVRVAIEKKRPTCANVMVRSPVPVPVDFDIALTIGSGTVEGTEAEARRIIDTMFQFGSETEYPEIRRATLGFGFTRAQLIANLMTLGNVLNVKVEKPVADIRITPSQLPVKGSVAIQVEAVE